MVEVAQRHGRSCSTAIRKPTADVAVNMLLHSGGGTDAGVRPDQINFPSC